MILRALVLALSLTGLVAPARAHADSPASSSGGTGDLPRDIIVAPVFLNGEGPFLFLVDTGATHTLVSRTLAERLRLRRSEPSREPGAGRRERPRIRSLGASIGATLAIADTLRVDTAVFEHVPVLTADLTALRAVARSLDGLIGQDLLARRSHLIDHASGRLRFDEDGAIRRELSGIPVPLALSHNRPMLTGVTRPAGARRTHGAAGGCMPSSERLALRLVLDSAATHVILLNDAARPIARRLAPLADRSVMSTHGGDRMVPMVRLDTLTLPTALFGELSAAVTPMPEDQERVEDGLLPTSLFRALYFDVAARTVILNPVWKPRETERFAAIARR